MLSTPPTASPGPMPPSVARSVVTWWFRLVLALAYAGLVWFAFKTDAYPSCGPWPKPDRWPALLPVLGVCGLAVLGVFWLSHRLRRAETAVWIAGILGATGGVLIVMVGALLFMSFMTLC